MSNMYFLLIRTFSLYCMVLWFFLIMYCCYLFILIDTSPVMADKMMWYVLCFRVCDVGAVPTVYVFSKYCGELRVPWHAVSLGGKHNTIKTIYNVPSSIKTARSGGIPNYVSIFESPRHRCSGMSTSNGSGCFVLLIRSSH